MDELRQPGALRAVGVERSWKVAAVVAALVLAVIGAVARVVKR
jgi:hypothetical protein